MVNSSDPANQLQWLVHILQASEDLGEKVRGANSTKFIMTGAGGGGGGGLQPPFEQLRDFGLGLRGVSGGGCVLIIRDLMGDDASTCVSLMIEM